MFKITKKDKRTDLEKEIDTVLEVMSDIKPYPNEDNRTSLDKAIDSLLADMATVKSDSDEYFNMAKNLDLLYKAKANDSSKLEEYSKMTENLERLYKAKSVQKSPSTIPWKEIVIGTFSMVQIFSILKFEKVDIITSKAMGYVFKGRV